MKKKEIEYFMEIAYKEALKAEKYGEVPVGSLIVCKETKQIISKSYNQTEKLNILLNKLPKTFQSPTMGPFCKDDEKYKVIEDIIIKINKLKEVSAFPAE